MFFSVARTTRVGLGLYCWLSLYHLDRAEQELFHFSHTTPYLLTPCRGPTCSKEHLQAGTLLWHMYKLPEMAWFHMIPEPEENLILSRQVKNHCCLSCQPLLSSCSPQARWGWGASRPAGVWRCLLCMLPAAQHSLLARSASPAGWAGVSPWDAWGSTFLQKPAVGWGW